MAGHGGQTINDRLLAARHSLAGQGLAKAVCKATTEELIGPKKKHLDYLVHCTNEPNVSIPQLANLLIERTQNTNWVVVFKALITVHHLLCYGNERFTQYLASSNSTFQLSSFLDKSGGAQGYDMSPFIRRYAKYLNEKALSYRTVAFDFCKVKRGKEDGTLRTMNAEKLLKTLPVLQAQVDALLEFDCSANDLTNGVINMCFMLLFRDLIRLFACYNDGIINLLEKYFDMNKKQCRDALDLYKKFLIRMDRVGEFLKVAENVGIDKGDIPDLTKAPSSLLDALEQHLAALEGRKTSAANTPTQSMSNNRTNVKTGVSALSSTSNAFGTAASSANGIDENLRKQALAEEAAAMRQYNAKVQSPVNSAATNPFLATSAAPAPAPIVDLFGGGGGAAAAPTATKASDDLLQLGNPFADMFGPPAPTAAAPVPAPAAAVPVQQAAWISNGFGGSQAASGTSFVSDTAFSSVFGGNDNKTAASQAAGVPNPFMPDLFGGGAPTSGPPRPPPPASGPSSPTKSALDDLNDSIRMALGAPAPTPANMPAPNIPLPTQPSSLIGSVPPPNAAFGPVDMASSVPAGTSMFPSPARMTAAPPVQPTNKILTGDLDSSLASLAENLTINKGAQQSPKGVQWNSPKNSTKPTGWSPQPMPATTGAGYRPMGQGMVLLNPLSPVPYPSQPFQRFPIGMPGAGMGAMAPGGGISSGVPIGQLPAQPQQQPQLDPFGALL